jgi:hypothetical protein
MRQPCLHHNESLTKNSFYYTNVNMKKMYWLALWFTAPLWSVNGPMGDDYYLNKGANKSCVLSVGIYQNNVCQTLASGVLVSPDLILTCAHSFHKFIPSDKVFYNSPYTIHVFDRNNWHCPKNSDAKATHITYSPSYKVYKNNSISDLALLKLDRSLPIPFATLPPKNLFYQMNTNDNYYKGLICGRAQKSKGSTDTRRRAYEGFVFFSPDNIISATSQNYIYTQNFAASFNTGQWLVPVPIKKDKIFYNNWISFTRKNASLFFNQEGTGIKGDSGGGFFLCDANYSYLSGIYLGGCINYIKNNKFIFPLSFDRIEPLFDKETGDFLPPVIEMFNKASYILVEKIKKNEPPKTGGFFAWGL